MKILQIDGYTEMTGDWTLAMALQAAGHEVRERECLENIGHENEPTPDDVEWADAFAVYSFGCASFWKLVDSFSTAKKALFIVLGVPDWAYGQIGSLWHPKSWIERQYCFQIDEAFPRSVPLQTVLDWVDVTDPDAVSKLLTLERANISCRSLFPQFANLVTMHTTTQNRKAVQDVIVGLLAAIAPPTVPTPEVTP